MLTLWTDPRLSPWRGGFARGDVEQTFFALDELRKEMDRWWTDFDRQYGGDRSRRLAAARFPRFDVTDDGNALTMRVELPGFDEKDLDISIEREQLTLSGKRKTELPEGYGVHRRERGDLSFTRAFSLPCRVDTEKTTAKLTDGVLELSLPKVAEEQPRQISVKAG